MEQAQGLWQAVSWATGSMPAVFAHTGKDCSVQNAVLIVHASFKGQLGFRPQVVAGQLDWALLVGKRLGGKAAVVMRSP